MSAVETRDDHGRSNGLAWFASIVEMVDKVRHAEREASAGLVLSDGQNVDDMREEAERAIHESVLSVAVRSGWYAMPSGPRDEADRAPAEYRIILTTGGPALQLTGDLDEHGGPETARLEYQDWGTPWTPLDAWNLAEHGMREAWKANHLTAIESVNAYLLDFARQFYFGEG